jgi:hypothetical protein
MYTYNTNQTPLKLREYGRNVQRLIGQLKELPSRSSRNQHVHNVLKIMGILHAAHNKTAIDHAQKRWDDLCYIADYQVDADLPYPIPNKVLLAKSPQRLPYSQNDIQYRHCGKHIELFIQKVLAVTDPSQQEQAILSIVRVIKSFNFFWNKDIFDNATILAMVQKVAGNRLQLNLDKLKINTWTNNHGDRRKTYKKHKNNHN